MRTNIAGFTIEKAGKETDLHLPVRMVANTLELDKENQEILPKAFSKATVGRFVKHGVIDWHHQSVMGKTIADRASAILGKPTSFEWEDGLPVVYANLTKSHPIVRDAILPHLEADQKVFAASVGGNVKKAKSVPGAAGMKDQIEDINWDHLAIAASPYVMSEGSEITMVKASGELMVNFCDTKAFLDGYEILFQGDDLQKALQVSAGTDSAALTGSDAMRKQSIEGGDDEDEDDKKKKKKKAYKALINEYLPGLQSGVIDATVKGFERFLKGKGLDDNQADDVVNRFFADLHQITT